MSFLEVFVIRLREGTTLTELMNIDLRLPRVNGGVKDSQKRDGFGGVDHYVVEYLDIMGVLKRARCCSHS